MKRKYPYIAPAILAIILLSANFMSTNIFSFSFDAFTVWFVLSLFCFVCGWIINKSLGWVVGGKVVFATIVAATVVSLFLISFFDGFFSTQNLLTENLILYTLRDVTLGVMALFGMSVSEIFALQEENISLREKNKVMEHNFLEAQKRAEIIIKEAELKAEKIIFEAEKKSYELLSRKEIEQRRLEEFIKAEKTLLEKYEDQ